MSSVHQWEHGWHLGTLFAWKSTCLHHRWQIVQRLPQQMTSFLAAHVLQTLMLSLEESCGCQLLLIEQLRALLAPCRPPGEELLFQESLEQERLLLLLLLLLSGAGGKLRCNVKKPATLPRRQPCRAKARQSKKKKRSSPCRRRRRRASSAALGER